MQAYVLNAIEALNSTKSFNGCLLEAKTTWLNQYLTSKYATNNTEHQTKIVLRKAQILFLSDWSALRMLIQHDPLCSLFYSCFELKHTFADTVTSYINNLATKDLLPYINDDNHALLSIKGPYTGFLKSGMKGHLPYKFRLPAINSQGWTQSQQVLNFPLYSSFVYFCTYLKVKWTHLQNIPPMLRFVPIMAIPKAIPKMEREASASGPPETVAIEPTAPKVHLQMSFTFSDDKWKANYMKAQTDAQWKVSWHDCVCLVVPDNQRGALDQRGAHNQRGAGESNGADEEITGNEMTQILLRALPNPIVLR